MHTRQQKEKLVSEVTEKVKQSKALVFTDYQGVTVKQLSGIRTELRKSGSSFQVLKKTLLDRALKQAGIDLSTRPFKGQIGIAFSSDEVAAAKAFAGFLKSNKETTLSIQGGYPGRQSALCPGSPGACQAAEPRRASGAACGNACGPGLGLCSGALWQSRRSGACPASRE
ncbi:MAG: 50S ribosomal protein L10 [Candidatus Moraniibacteriota bacterium]